MRTIPVVSLSITDRCNLQCGHCNRNSDSTRFIAATEPSLHQLSNLFSALSNYGTSMIVLSGGEPLLRQDLENILACAADHGINCGLLTNGMLLSKARIRKLIASGALDFIRLSVEYPATYFTSGKRQKVCHDTNATLTALSRCADAGIATGVNMTLMSGNLSFTDELAETCRKNGASFFRMVPVVPLFNHLFSDIDTLFFSACVNNILEMHVRYQPRRLSSSDNMNITSMVNSFVKPCESGLKSLSISTNGAIRICPMIDCGESSSSCYTNPVSECISYVNRRRTYLQRRIIASGTQSCNICNDNKICRGGCIAEWYSRGRPAGQPICYRTMISGSIASAGKKSDQATVLSDIASNIDLRYLFGGCYPCLRGLPLWTIRFTDNNLDTIAV